MSSLEFLDRTASDRLASSRNEARGLVQTLLAYQAEQLPRYEPGLEVKAQLVHGGHRRSVDQSGLGAHDGEARQCQDDRSAF